ncbi:unnamed protein product [Parnassius apollo]|uniref:(apollo) hypothetical protein n=1 Tax=Parnassius apollo TaxID=110799 RepID=A0A8S3XJZ5_PARAO|nr:unnamed protein product [Parnassius apollo]
MSDWSDIDDENQRKNTDLDLLKTSDIDIIKVLQIDDIMELTDTENGQKKKHSTRNDRTQRSINNDLKMNDNPQKEKKLSDETKYTELNNNKVTVLSSVRFTPENRPFIGLKTCATLKLEPVDKQFNLSSNLKRKDLQGESLDKENTPVKRLRTPAMKVKSNDKELIKIKKPQISVKFEYSNKTAYDMKNKTEKRQNKVGTSQTDDFESKVREYESLLCENGKKSEEE